MRSRSSGALPFAAACLLGCVAAHGGAGEVTGTASLAVTNVPGGVSCIQVTASGNPTVTQSFDVATGEDSSTLAMSGLPVGGVDFTGSAYAVDCAAGSAHPADVGGSRGVDGDRSRRCRSGDPGVSRHR